MPTYEYRCGYCSDFEFEMCVPMNDRDDQACPRCEQKEFVLRQMAAPSVMNVAMADGTRRFDNIRRYRALEKAKKAESDKKQQAKLEADMNKISGRSA